MAARPSDQTATATTLRRLAGAGVIEAGALERALELTGSRPTATSWTDFVYRKLLLIGALLLAVGVIFFAAANWSALGPYLRLGLAAAALIAATVVAWLRGRDDLPGRVAALLAGLLFGPLMAIYGQTYQTGADSWGLFMSWALVMAAYAAASRFPGAWIAALALCHLAVLLAWGQLIGGDWASGGRVWPHVLLAAGDGLLVLALERGALGASRSERGALAVLRTAVFFGLSLLTLSAFRAIFADLAGIAGMDGLEVVAALACAAAAIGAVFAVYSRRIPDLFPLACATAATCTLLSAGLARLLFDVLETEEAFSFLFLGAAICAQVGLAGKWLLSRRHPPKGENETPSPEGGQTKRPPEGGQTKHRELANRKGSP